MSRLDEGVTEVIHISWWCYCRLPVCFSLLFDFEGRDLSFLVIIMFPPSGDT